MLRSRIAWAAAVLLLAACATPLPPDCTAFGRSGGVCLLPPVSLPAVEGSHLVKITRDGQQDAFMGLLKIDAHTLQLAGFSLFGTSLFDIVYDGHSVQSRPEQPALKPDMLVVMLELAIADPALLQGRLHGLTLTTGSRNGLQSRDVYERGQLIVHIEESAGPLESANLRIDVPPLKLSVEMTPMPGATATP
jgi:hypothetical protein